MENENKDLSQSPYICPICKDPYWIIRKCDSRFDVSLAKSVKHTPAKTVPRKLEEY
jgi:hypothetical protein